MQPSALPMRRLLDEFQRGFPITPMPFDALARQLGVTRDWVLSALSRLTADGTVSRVGAVFRPGCLGTGTLAAMAVPAQRLWAVARTVSAQPEINHNYEREHRLNLWFVATGEDPQRLQAVLTRIERLTGLRVISLPLVRDYYIDLGFPLDGAVRKPGPVAAGQPGPAQPLAPDRHDRALLRALQDGLPLTAKPFVTLAGRAGWREPDAAGLAMERIRTWIEQGSIKRFGVIVRHRALGFTANAMCAWDICDDQVDQLGLEAAQEPAVTLCYRRQRAAAAWPYNLFCMIHGRDRATVEAELRQMARRVGLDAYPGTVLFSRQAFKQRGARHVAVPECIDG